MDRKSTSKKLAGTTYKIKTVTFTMYIRRHFIYTYKKKTIPRYIYI